MIGIGFRLFGRFPVLIISVFLLPAGLIISGCIVEKQKLERQRGVIFMELPAPPGIPELLSPEVIATPHHERDAALSPAGNEFFYTQMLGSRGVILRLERQDGKWLGPEVASFSGVYSDLEPSFSPDGSRLYFASNRPIDTNGPAKDYDIWVCDRGDQGWGQPYNLGAPINTERNEFYPSVSISGALYFTGRPNGGWGQEDICVSRWENGRYLPPQALDTAINSSGYEYNAYVAPDEKVIIFTALGRPDGFGGGDLYISFRDDNGLWNRAANMGPDINSSAEDFCPLVSLDGALFFFTSSRSSVGTVHNEPMNYHWLMEMLDNPKNGNLDIYWVNGEIIRALRPIPTE